MKELGMRVVHADDDAQVLLDPRDKELEKSPAFVLVSHFILELGE